MTETTTRSILIATDFSQQAAAARDQAFDLATRWGCDVTLVHVVVPPETWDVIVGSIELGLDNKKLLDASLEGARARLAEMSDKLRDTGVTVNTRAEIGHPDVVIPQLAAELGATMVCMGTHGHDSSEHLGLGSVAERVVRSAECNVLVARASSTAPGGYRNILVPTDFSELAEAALAEAIHLVANDGTIEVAHWWHTSFAAHGYYASFETPAEYRDRVKATVAERGEQLISKYRDHHPAITFKAFAGTPSRAIPEYLLDQTNYDLIAMGSHGRRGIRRLLLGSVAEKVLRHAPSTVLIVHQG